MKDKSSDKSQNNVKSRTPLEPVLADIRTVSAPKPLDSSKSKQVTANVSKVSGRQTRSPQKDKRKQCSDRVPKGARDPVALVTRSVRWRRWALHHQHPPHAFEAFLPNEIISYNPF